MQTIKASTKGIFSKHFLIAGTILMCCNNTFLHVKTSYHFYYAKYGYQTVNQILIYRWDNYITKPRSSKPVSCKQSKIFFLHSQMLISQAFGFFYLQKGWYVALCSTSDRAALQMLKDNPHLRTVYLCLDNDNAGLLGCERIADSVHALGDYTIWRVPPQNKDWDEDLKALNGREAIPAEQESTPETNNIELTM